MFSVMIAVVVQLIARAFLDEALGGHLAADARVIVVLRDVDDERFAAPFGVELGRDGPHARWYCRRYRR
jgi:hypothetical protein